RLARRSREPLDGWPVRQQRRDRVQPIFIPDPNEFDTRQAQPWHSFCCACLVTAVFSQERIRRVLWTPPFVNPHIQILGHVYSPNGTSRLRSSLSTGHSNRTQQLTCAIIISTLATPRIVQSIAIRSSPIQQLSVIPSSVL